MFNSCFNYILESVKLKLNALQKEPLEQVYLILYSLETLEIISLCNPHHVLLLQSMTVFPV